jgi:hypothetical protein
MWSYDGYKYLRLFDSANTIAKVNHNGFRSFTKAGVEDFDWAGREDEHWKQAHYNIQPYVTLRMIIKIDEEI